MITNIDVSVRTIAQIERQLRSGGKRIPAEVFIEQGIPLVQILGALLALEDSGKADLAVEDGTLWLIPKGD